MYVCFCLSQSIDDLVKDEECPAYLLKSKPCKCSFYIYVLPTKEVSGDILVLVQTFRRPHSSTHSFVSMCKLLNR